MTDVELIEQAAGVMEDYPINLIQWLEQENQMIVVSVGFILYEDDTMLVLVPELALDEEEDKHSGDFEFGILKSSIVYRKILNPID